MHMCQDRYADFTDRWQGLGRLKSTGNTRMYVRLTAMTSVMALSAVAAHADAFNRIASFPTFLNNADAMAERWHDARLF